MLDIDPNINSLSNSKRNAPEFLRQLKETGHPVVLTINGKAELVVQDSASYQKLIELAERSQRLDALFLWILKAWKFQTYKLGGSKSNQLH